MLDMTAKFSSIFISFLIGSTAAKYTSFRSEYLCFILFHFKFHLFFVHVIKHEKTSGN